MEFIEKLIDCGDGKGITNRDAVEHAVINAKLPSTIFLANEKNRGGEWTLAWLNNPVFEHLRDKARNFPLLEVQVMVGADGDWSLSWLDDNFVVCWSLWREAGRNVEEGRKFGKYLIDTRRLDLRWAVVVVRNAQEEQLTNFICRDVSTQVSGTHGQCCRYLIDQSDLLIFMVE